MTTQRCLCLLSFVVTVIFNSFSQEPTWLYHYGNGVLYYTEGFNICPSENGGLYGVATIGAPSLTMDTEEVFINGSRDILLAKWDSTGHTIWARTAGGSCDQLEFEYGTRIAFDSLTGNVIIGGSYNCSVTNIGGHILTGSGDIEPSDMFIASYDPDGDCLWARGINSFRSGPLALLIDGNSDVFVIGEINGETLVQGDPSIHLDGSGLIAKYSVNGSLLSAESVTTAADLRHAAWISDDEWILTGVAYPGATLYGTAIPVQSPITDGFVARTDTTGAIQWLTPFSSSRSCDVWRCATSPNGAIVVSGTYLDSLFLPLDTLTGTLEGGNAFMASLDPSDGSILWAIPISSPTQSYVYDLKFGPEGDIYAFGRFQTSVLLGNATLNAQTTTDGFLAKFSPFGNCIAASNFGRIQIGRSGSILPTENGLFLSCDYDSTLTVGSSIYACTQFDIPDLFIAKFDTLSGFTGVQQLNLGDHGLHIYANPTNGICTIDLPDGLQPTNDLMLAVYDQQGHLVQRAPLLFSDHGLRLDIRAQARGIYHVELGDGRQRYTGTIVFE
jgi:hypothetical protein